MSNIWKEFRQDHNPRFMPANYAITSHEVQAIAPEFSFSITILSNGGGNIVGVKENGEIEHVNNPTVTAGVIVNVHYCPETRMVINKRVFKQSERPQVIESWFDIITDMEKYTYVWNTRVKNIWYSNINLYTSNDCVQCRDEVPPNGMTLSDKHLAIIKTMVEMIPDPMDLVER